jgi:hypothetical protein
MIARRRRPALRFGAGASASGVASHRLVSTRWDRLATHRFALSACIPVNARASAKRLRTF